MGIGNGRHVNKPRWGLAVRRRNRDFDIFSLSFLDVISCGFGAIVMLVLITRPFEEAEPVDNTRIPELLSEVLKTETSVNSMTTQLVEAREALDTKRLLLNRLRTNSAATAEQNQNSDQIANRLADDLRGLSLVESSLKRASIRPKTAKFRDDEVGGIPVDSDYVVFIVDTSGSMKEIWDRVLKEIINVINIHPKIKGFQILNDNGAHLISGYQGKWIPDTPRRRKAVIDLFKTWNSASNSSPVEGLTVALKRYVQPNIKVSIYIFGDEYSGSSYDPVINALVRMNTSLGTGKTLAKVHAVGFISNYSTGRFATLMREVTRRNNGTFIGLPR
jgi:hypothetical protein